MFSCFKCFLVLVILQVCQAVNIPPEDRVPCAQKRLIIVQKICDFCQRAHRPPPCSSSSSSSSSSSLSSLSSIEDDSAPIPKPLSLCPSALPGLPVYPGTYPVPPGGAAAGAVPPVPPNYQHQYPAVPLSCPPCVPLPSAPFQRHQIL